ncbi:acetyl-CoA hydrolase/transferase family protein [Henriciella litoralis]|uniref:acetyl-CoA hydrolase/transferase family protein n=1 Tax=Henriciella litoralis TaxID=568102 RepID=UPI0009FFEFCE|nr:acetyl-CoA hydrolase/transferase C-terminal domain-containing protein [Henriciella litoralis]
MRAGREIELEALDWPSLVRKDDLVIWGQASAEPDSLTRSLMQARHGVGRFGVFAGISFGESVSPENTDCVDYISYCGAGSNRSLEDQLDILPLHYTRLAEALVERSRGAPVILLRLAAGADADHFSFGAGADYTADLLPHARLVIAEISPATPCTGQGRDLHRSDVDLIVRTDAHCLTPPAQKRGEVDAAIARNVASLIEDGSTLQIGLGSLPAAILASLKDHRDLGIHSGLVPEGVAELSEAGVITNLKKTIDTGSTVAGVLSGDTKLMAWANGNRHLLMKPASYTHAANVLSQIDNFIAINSAIEVGLSGEVNAELAGGRYVGAVGGAANFMRGAAASTGGKSIIALPSTNRGRSRIVAELSGPVTTPRSDVHFVVTEYGIADLRNATLHERRERMKAIAHPDHQGSLQ